ncbi:MAG: MopE-related protein [Phycisphaerae bacterium]|nr:MopE-related protein [Phycisphaerae bacterium]
MLRSIDACRVGTLCKIAVLLLCATGAVAQLAPGQHAAGPAVRDLQAAEPYAFGDKANLTPAQRKVSADLRVSVAQISSRAAGRDEVLRSRPSLLSNRFRKVDDVGMIQCYVEHSGDPQVVAAAIANAGGKIELLVPEARLIQCRLAYDQVTSLASVEGVRLIRLPAYAMTRSGPVNSQGDWVHRCDSVRSTWGFNGAGRKVGIISDGINGIGASQASGDIPASCQARSARADGNLYAGAEGTAMMEIVHDLAPGAALAFSNPGTSAEMITAISTLDSTFNCNVICDDLGFADEPFFEDGPIVTRINQAVANGAIYVSAAGNSAYTPDGQSGGYYHESQYVGMARTIGGTSMNVQDFGGGDWHIKTYVPGNGGVVAVALQWNDSWGGSRNDYDLLLTDSTGDKVYAVSDAVQDGNDNPVEYTAVINNGASGAYVYVVISRYSGASRHLKITSWGDGWFTERYAATGSIWGHPSAVNAMACGAVRWSTPDVIEPFSSRGPVRIDFPTLIYRNKPDMVGVDGMSVTGNGGFPTTFYGTSAAAPHVAALCAQAWSARPSDTNSAIRNLVQSTAVNLGSLGWDPIYGYGRADAVDAVGATNPATPGDPTASDNMCGDKLLNRTGAPPAGVTWYWQGTSCGALTDPKNSGQTYVATSSGTYYIRARRDADGSWSTGCGSIAITVNPLPAAPSSASATPSTICSVGGSSNLSASVGTGEETVWYTTAAGGTPFGTGSPSVSPAATTIYYAAAHNKTTLCESSSRTSVTVTVEPATTYYADADSDTYGNASITTEACDAPVGYVADGTDCDDGNALINPAATEVCDSVDNNCDGQTDEGAVGPTWYQDLDGDNYGTTVVAQQACTQPNGSAAESTDCDDSSAAVNPGATETCNGVDDDCDGEIDEGVKATFYADVDGDGYGNAAVGQQSCSQPTGCVTNRMDCNDANNAINPAATEVHDGVDNDCDTFIDEGVSNAYYRDVDEDTFGDPNNVTYADELPAGYVPDNTDCDDTNAAINPAATEVCDGVDNNCDTSIDKEVKSTFYADTDGDTYGDAGSTTEACTAPPGYVTDGTDCDDNAAAVHPGTAEACNGIDDDCDGVIDEEVKTTFYADADSDRFGNPTVSEQACSVPAGYVMNNRDCDDTSAAIKPGAAETCNGVDDDCDSRIDEGVKATFHADLDGDGYGDAGNTTKACVAPTGYVADNTDCDDGNNAVHPGATEVCNGLDDDCDTKVDEGVSNTFYRDADGDMYGTPNDGIQVCTPPEGYVSNSADCDDGNIAIHPGATETCNSVDDDCDNTIDESVSTTFYVDADGDGYGDASNMTEACTAPSGYVPDNTDCNDYDPNSHPGASDMPNDHIDQDCDGSDATSDSGDSQPGGILGSVQVMISPQEAIDAGAQWCVDGGTWQESGATATALSIGNHTISFSDIPGWMRPVDQAVDVVAGQTTSTTGAYTPPPGSLQVTIGPPEAVSAGAQWRVDGGDWQSSGMTLTNLQVGSHSLSFKDVAGWITPTDQAVTIVDEQTATAAGTYTQQTFTLRILTTPGAPDPAPMQYPAGELVDVSAPDPDEGYRFSHWSGDATGTENPITVVMDSDKTITANYVQDIEGPRALCGLGAAQSVIGVALGLGFMQMRRRLWA